VGADAIDDRHAIASMDEAGTCGAITIGSVRPARRRQCLRAVRRAGHARRQAARLGRGGHFSSQGVQGCVLDVHRGKSCFVQRVKQASARPIRKVYEADPLEWPVYDGYPMVASRPSVVIQADAADRPLFGQCRR